MGFTRVLMSCSLIHRSPMLRRSRERTDAGDPGVLSRSVTGQTFGKIRENPVPELLVDCRPSRPTGVLSRSTGQTLGKIKRDLRSRSFSSVFGPSRAHGGHFGSFCRTISVHLRLILVHFGTHVGPFSGHFGPSSAHVGPFSGPWVFTNM